MKSHNVKSLLDSDSRIATEEKTKHLSGNWESEYMIDIWYNLQQLIFDTDLLIGIWRY